MRTLCRRMVWLWLFIIAYVVAGWFLFEYEREEWSKIALAVGFICLGMSQLQSWNYKIWVALGLVGIGLSVVLLLLKLVG